MINYSIIRSSHSELNSDHNYTISFSKSFISAKSRASANRNAKKTRSVDEENEEDSRNIQIEKSSETNVGESNKTDEFNKESFASNTHDTSPRKNIPVGAENKNSRDISEKTCEVTGNTKNQIVEPEIVMIQESGPVPSGESDIESRGGDDDRYEINDIYTPDSLLSASEYESDEEDKNDGSLEDQDPLKND